MPPAPDDPHCCSVLVIDDNRDVRRILTVALAADGYHVATADSGRGALAHLRSTADTCMIVLDLTLPTMDGSGFRAAQLRDRSLAWIPVVVVSGSPDGVGRARAIGARAFLPKPLDLDALRTALGNIGCCHARPRHEQRTSLLDVSGER